MRGFFGARRWYTNLSDMIEKGRSGCRDGRGGRRICIFECGKQVLAAGLPLMMEKPPARLTAHARELADMAAGRGLITQIGHNMRHAPGVQKFSRVNGDARVWENCFFWKADILCPGPMWQVRFRLSRGLAVYDFSSQRMRLISRVFWAGKSSAFTRILSVGEGGRFAIACTAHFDSGATGMITLTGCTPNWTCKIEAAGDARAHFAFGEFAHVGF